jgi:ZF-HD class homeobox domain-containing protein
MELGAQEGDLQMPMSGGFSGLHETSKLKLIASGNGTGMDESTPRPLEASKVKKITKYRECLKNHAASIGGNAIDGCGEFMPKGEEGTVDALKCAACDCHRNFHKREVEGEPSCDCQQRGKDRKRSTPGTVPHTPLALPATTVIARPPAPLLMTLSNGPADSDDQDGGISANAAAMKKRFRTKFSAEQKEKMCSFADKLGWKIQKHDEGAVQAFCADVGVKRHVLKVWMHNNKHTLGKKI